MLVWNQNIDSFGVFWLRRFFKARFQNYVFDLDFWLLLLYSYKFIPNVLTLDFSDYIRSTRIALRKVTAHHLKLPIINFCIKFCLIFLSMFGSTWGFKNTLRFYSVRYPFSSVCFDLDHLFEPEISKLQFSSSQLWCKNHNHSQVDKNVQRTSVDQA